MKKIVFCILPVLFSDVSSFPLPQPVCGSEQICQSHHRFWRSLLHFGFATTELFSSLVFDFCLVPRSIVLVSLCSGLLQIQFFFISLMPSVLVPARPDLPGWFFFTAKLASIHFFCPISLLEFLSRVNFSCLARRSACSPRFLRSPAVCCFFRSSEFSRRCLVFGVYAESRRSRFVSACPGLYFPAGLHPPSLGAHLWISVGRRSSALIFNYDFLSPNWFKLV
jgi:hypothetical protein